MKTVQIQISWLLKKPADLDLHCFQSRRYPGSAGQGLNIFLQHMSNVQISKYRYFFTNWPKHIPFAAVAFIPLLTGKLDIKLEISKHICNYTKFNCEYSILHLW